MVTTSGVISQDALRIAARAQQNVEQPRTDISQLSRPVLQNAQVAQQQTEFKSLTSATPSEPSNDSVRVSSTIGKAASSGMLTRDEAVAIYQKIANML